MLISFIKILMYHSGPFFFFFCLCHIFKLNTKNQILLRKLAKSVKSLCKRWGGQFNHEQFTLRYISLIFFKSYTQGQMFLKIYNSKTAKSSLSLLKKLTLIKNQYPTKPDQDIYFFFYCHWLIRTCV